MRPWAPIASAIPPHLPHSHKLDFIHARELLQAFQALVSPSYLLSLFFLLRMPFIHLLFNLQTSDEVAPAL